MLALSSMQATRPPKKWGKNAPASFPFIQCIYTGWKVTMKSWLMSRWPSGTWKPQPSGTSLRKSAIRCPRKQLCCEVESSCWLRCTKLPCSWCHEVKKVQGHRYGNIMTWQNLWHKDHEGKVGHFRVHFRYLELWYRDAGIQPALVQSCPTRRPAIEIPWEVSTESTVDLFIFFVSSLEGEL